VPSSQAHPDTPAKLVAFAYAFEHLEIGGYEQLRRVAERVGDESTIRTGSAILDEERAAAAKLEGAFDAAVRVPRGRRRGGGRVARWVAGKRVSRVGVAAGSSPQFAHPVEFELARVFDRFGIEWRYEPRTFVLERREGRVVEACAPDFYLPELDMYVECTCMDQRLVSKKNRRYRKLRERFGVEVEIMYFRDFVRLGRRHGLTELLRAASSNGNGHLR
jgi:Domain of unknown function (DUF892)